METVWCTKPSATQLDGLWRSSIRAFVASVGSFNEPLIAGATPTKIHDFAAVGFAEWPKSTIARLCKLPRHTNPHNNTWQEAVPTAVPCLPRPTWVQAVVRQAWANQAWAAWADLTFTTTTKPTRTGARKEGMMSMMNTQTSNIITITKHQTVLHRILNHQMIFVNNMSTQATPIIHHPP